MKATGIVRRIDELGRIVIPKEIRRIAKVKDGDPMEIFTGDDGTVILKKYSVLQDLQSLAKDAAESLNRGSGHLAIIGDRDIVLAVSGSTRKEYVDKYLGKGIIELMMKRNTYQGNRPLDNMIAVLGEEPDGRRYNGQTIVPIICEGEPIGVVMLLSTNPGASMGEAEMKVANMMASFISKQVSA